MPMITNLDWDEVLAEAERQKAERLADEDWYGWHVLDVQAAQEFSRFAEDIRKKAEEARNK